MGLSNNKTMDQHTKQLNIDENTDTVESVGKRSMTFVPEGSGVLGNWSERDTKRMLNCLIDNQNSFGPFQRFKNKKIMWENISGQLMKFEIYRSASQCESKYKKLKKKRNEIIAYNRTSGNNKRSFEYESEFEILKREDDTIDPEVQCGIGQLITKTDDNERKRQAEECQNTKDKNKRSKSVSSLLEDLHRQKEESKERRHKEKLEALRELKELLSKN